MCDGAPTMSKSLSFDQTSHRVLGIKLNLLITFYINKIFFVDCNNGFSTLLWLRNNLHSILEMPKMILKG